MANALPWSVKGVDPRTRDAAKAAARRAGMTLGEWLDSVIREESDDVGAVGNELPEDVHDLDSLSERLSRLSRGQTDTAPAAHNDFSRQDIETALATAAVAEKRTRDANAKTANALDSITRWIEKTEGRLAAGERTSAERQERATHVIAEAIKTMGTRISDIERNATGERQATRPAFRQTDAAMRHGASTIRPTLSRESVASAISDIRTRQRDLDETPASITAHVGAAEGQDFRRDRRATDPTLAALREDLRQLSQRIAAPAPARTRPDATDALRDDMMQLRREIASMAAAPATRDIERTLRDLSGKLDRPAPAMPVDAMLRPLARIEAEVTRLADSASGESYHRIEQELGHLTAKLDAMAAHGSDGRALAAATRELADLRDVLSNAAGGHRLDDLGHQLSAMSAEIGRVREAQADRTQIGGIGATLSELRTMLQEERSAKPVQDSGALVSLSRQIELLAGKIDRLPAMKSVDLDGHVAQITQRLDGLSQAGQPASEALSRRIEGLVIKLEDLADRAPARLEGRIDALQSHLETFASKPASAVERQIEALSARIESLAAATSLSAVVSGKGAKGAVADLRPVEELLHSLSAKIDDVSRPGAGREDFEALEKQISGLASRLDQGSATRNADQAIDRTLRDMMSSLDGVRQDSAATAEKAARIALADMAADLAARSQSPDFSALHDSMSGLRETHDSAGRRTQDAIEAVHSTLGKIMSRLSVLEADLVSERQDADRQHNAIQTSLPPVTRPAQATPVQVEQVTAPVAPPRRAEVAAASEPALPKVASLAATLKERFIQSSAPEPKAPVAVPRAAERAAPAAGATAMLDMPLEPGSGRPKPGSAPASSPVTAPAAQPAMASANSAASADSQAVKQGFIAAARRAAQAAAIETQAANDAGSKKTAKGATPGRLGQIMDKRRKPILLGLAAIVFAIGAAHVVTGALTGDQAETPAKAVIGAGPKEAVATKEAAAPKAATQATPAEPIPAKDQSSAAPARDKPETTASAPANPLDGKTAAAIAPVLQPSETPAVPPAIAAAEPVTGIKDIPPTLGTPGQRRAALEGDARAVYELAVKAADATGTARDPKVALRLFERAAAAGLAPAQFRLGNMFEKGIGTGRDIALARLWYERAADKGNAKAMHNLAVLYAEGASGKPDYATAVQWFRQAAEHGVRDSQYNLAILMARGLGTAQDLTQSYTWFAVAAAQGDEDAGKKREEVAGQLQPADLTAAKAAVSRWQAKTPVPGANEVVSPQGGWDESPAAPAKKPAKISRG